MQRIKLLSPAKDSAKMIKNEGSGFTTAILYLAQANMSGYRVCPKKSSASCEAGCLGSAGMAAVFKSVHRSRIAKTRLFFEDRPLFMANLVLDLEALVRKAEKLGEKPACRLNGTSDLDWEKIKTDNGQNVFQRFPMIQFWDYTAVLSRLERRFANPVPNHHITFSRKANNDKDVMAALDMGFNVSIVLKVKKSQSLPLNLYGIPCQDGTLTDLRFLDTKQINGSWIALRALGKAKQDESGFAVAV